MDNKPVSYPPPEEDFDWAKAKAKLDEEFRAEAETLRKARHGNGDNKGPTLNHQDWKEKQPEIERESYSTNGDSNDHYEEDTGEVSEIEGELPPLIDEGPRVMVCIHYELRQTRFALKDYLKWIDENTGLLLHQFFHHYNKYPVGSKAVLNYIVGMRGNPRR